MHRLYSRQPPHDASLYDLLGVAPNCTLREVQAAYRKRSREYHPDQARVRAARMKRNRRAESGSEDEPPTSEELLEQEQEKAQAAVLGALQVEALWKIAKIELDRTILEACGRILDGDYFFFPSHQQPLYFDTSSGGYCDDEQGWVGEGGEIIDTEVGRLRAAAAMVLVGDTMVECSKDGTSWVD